jgi:hypothetical protein
MKVAGIIVFVIANLLVSVFMFPDLLAAADETVEVDCSAEAPPPQNVQVNPGEKLRWHEKNGIEFRIEFDVNNNNGGRKSPFKKCFIFCVEHKNLSPKSAKQYQKIRVKKSQYGNYHYRVYCTIQTVIDPIVQIPRPM